MVKLLAFLKEMPHIYLLFVLLIILLTSYGLFKFDFLRDSIVGVAGAIVALSRISTAQATTNQIKTDNIENVDIAASSLNQASKEATEPPPVSGHSFHGKIDPS